MSAALYLHVPSQQQAVQAEQQKQHQSPNFKVLVKAGKGSAGLT